MVISFGDGYIDLSMIEFAKFGVAMANAVDEKKESGLYHFIK
ncbi:MAG: HAD hydrolase family protein [Streptococcus sp.]